MAESSALIAFNDLELEKAYLWEAHNVPALERRAITWWLMKTVLRFTTGWRRSLKTPANISQTNQTYKTMQTKQRNFKRCSDKSCGWGKN
jgi:hypothetical protein